MKTRSLSKLSLYLLLCCAVVFTVGLIGGCKGSNGAAGAPGTGHDATFANSTCANCHHMSDQTTNSVEPFRISGIATGGTATSGTAVGAKVKTVFSNGTYTVNAAGYYWQFFDGLAATTSAVVNGPTFTVTVTPGQDFRTFLVTHEKLADRTMVVPINGFSQEMAQNAEYTVTVFGDDGKIYYDLAKIKTSDAVTDVAKYAPVLSPGINNVPINMPVLLNAEGTGPYTWSFTTNPGITAALDATNIKNPYFVPDVPGQYVLQVITTPTGTTVPVTDTLTLYAGTWRGAITGVDMNTLTADGNGTPVPDGACTVCHNDTIAPDKFTPWKSTGHATRFEEGLNGGGYGSSCFSCHTVGFDDKARGDNGFRDQPNYTAFTTDASFIASGVDNTRYSRMATSATYSTLFKETGIQCENCHGPQTSNGHMTSNSAGSGPRTSLAADVCGRCHGSPQHHGRFQEFQESETGHDNFDLAMSEGTNKNCAGCHSAQGHLVWIKQLVTGNPLRGIPTASVTWNASNVQPQTCSACHDPHNVGTTTGLATDAQPRISILMNAAFGAAAVGNTPKLPAGFAALGVGKGAQCMLCHNSRTGGLGLTAADGTSTGANTAPYAPGSYLHEDNDPVFGANPTTASSSSGLIPTPPAYSTPHSPCQTDVLMGHNAYFMGDSGGNTSKYKSPHATIIDTCVNCHMAQTKPPQEFSDYENTNHVFRASLEICGTCHGVSMGLGEKLQGDTLALMDLVREQVQGYVISKVTGTITINSVTGTVTAITGGTNSKGDPTPAAYNVTLNVGGTPTSFTNVAIGTLLPLTANSDLTLAKIIWNWTLIYNDESYGVHNPGFTRDVLGATYAASKDLP